MARNEEKQLARLNRVYLLQQKEEQLKKRPPRPKLETLTTVNDIKQWIPSIMRDIEFYVTQMEVTCYPGRQIEEFERRVGHLRGEYKAFIRKIRELEPNLDATPWSDRPYTGKQRKLDLSQSNAESSNEKDKDKCDDDEVESPQTMTLIATPVLTMDSFYTSCYGYSSPQEPAVDDIDPDLQSKPLNFDFSKLTSSPISKKQMHGLCDQQQTPEKSSHKPVSDKKGGKSLLNLPYSDSSSSEGEDTELK